MDIYYAQQIANEILEGIMVYDSESEYLYDFSKCTDMNGNIISYNDEYELYESLLQSVIGKYMYIVPKTYFDCPLLEKKSKYDDMLLLVSYFLKNHIEEFMNSD